MCGICGIVDWAGGEIDESLLVRMRDVMRSRGPDDEGLHLERGVGLGHRRLSIIDLSPAGHQPMANETQTVWIAFNGEIYNFQELREELLAAGHQFRSRSDTEVLIHGYEQWGLEGLARRITGMFGVALWDRDRRQLHLLRDHLGKKPVFYRRAGGRVFFASDIKSIWLAAGGPLPLDPEAMDEFLYNSVISQERTIFQGVQKLPPGSFATFEAEKETERKYWSPDYTQKENRSAEEWIEGIDHHLRRAVKRRLMADVPLGGFLSGGVDSSTVCALMAAEGTTRPKTFSVGFAGDARFDEREFSRAVAEHIGSEHTEMEVRPDAAPILSSLVWHYGEPYGDSSMIPTYLIAREARKHVTVVLTGDGGDEAFAGYGRHLRADMPRRCAGVPAFIRKGLVPLAAWLVRAIAPATLLARNFQATAGYLAGRREALASDTCWFDGLRDRLYSDSLRRSLGGFHPLESQRPLLNSLGGPTPLDRALEYLIRTTLANDYLVKVDVATMAHALEARCPFLDVELLEFAMKIPSDVLVTGNEKKALLKRYAAGLVPPKVIYRKKHGFAVPIRHWFRDEWREPVRRLLLSKQATDRGYFRPRAIQRVLEEHAGGRRNHAARIWTLLVLEVWHRLFVDRSMQPGDPVLEPLS